VVDGAQGVGGGEGAVGVVGGEGGGDINMIVCDLAVTFP